MQATYITDDTERIAAEANKDLIAATVEYAVEATRFDGLALPEDVARKLKLLKLSLSLPAPRDPKMPDRADQPRGVARGHLRQGQVLPARQGVPGHRRAVAR